MNITQNNDTVSEVDITNNMNCTESIGESQAVMTENNSTTTEQHSTTPENIAASNASEAIVVTLNKNTNNGTINNKIENENDQVLEYLYKKNEVQNEISKAKGHPKNSLRKKRSIDYTSKPKYSADIKNAPLIIDYKTTHEREHVEPLTTTPSPFGPNAAKVIKESALADFNIETLHDNRNDDKAPRITISNGSQKQYAKNIDSNESNGSSESTDNNKSNESDENKGKYRSSENNQSNESVEKENYEKRNEYPLKPNEGVHSEYKQNSGEDSREVKTTELPKIQEVDLDDFSYEKIQVNAKGEIEPTKELSENHDKDIADDSTATTTNNPVTYSAEINEQKANYNTEPVHIDDDKIKPVIERNEESNESSEESGDLKLFNTDNSQTGNKAFSPPFINQPQNNYNPIIENNEKKVNVKDEFERIPLNYNHDKNNATQDDKNNKEVTPKDTKPTKFEQPESFTQPPPSDDITEFVLPEQPVVYDDKLNFKFSDLTIKLPEIKLPEDILAYSYYDDPPKEKQNKKQQKQPKFFYYDHDDDGEENERNSQYNDEPDYNDNKYYSNDRDKDNYRKHPQKEEKDEESVEEEEDLYEKFVRERFGKRGTFQKRSEELRALPQDLTLRDTIKKVLKKAHETSKEAEKSGDPNAGYMWTLEYQQPL